MTKKILVRRGACSGMGVITVVMLVAVGLILATGKDVSALPYQNTINQTFTLNESLSISLSSPNLRIDELIPGQSSDSNTITVTVLSNNAYGYNLSANTGNTTYNTTNLVNQAGASYNFASLDPTASIDTPSSFTDNTWGFSYCDYNNAATCSSWNNYSGLPIYSAGANKELKNTETASAAAGDKLDFKIAARASTSQAGGEYNNVVNFIAIGNPKPPIYMQDLDEVQAEIAEMQPGEDLEVVDKRDNKTYTVAKMADGNIWMNQNLDLELDSSTPLTSENTDLNESGSGAYSDGYTKDPTTNVITWTPASTATTSNVSISGISVTGWTDSSTAPYSAEGGDVYVYTSGSTSYDTVYNSLAECTGATTGRTEAECKHYHRGNYYNWTAAIASNASSSISSDGSTAANSVCPKGWRLPKGNENGSTYEFGTVLLNAGVIGSIPGVGSSVTYASGGFNKIRSTPLYLVRSGLISSSTLRSSASDGSYWSSTVYSSDSAYYLYFYSSGVYPRNYSGRLIGFSVRCLAPAS